MDSTFLSLPDSIQRRIDQAFDAVHNGEDGRSVNNKPVMHERVLEDTRGGFMLPDRHSTADSGGGFIIEEDTKETSRYGRFITEDVEMGDSTAPSTAFTTHIPLSMIPTALQILDLPPDDEQILSVFRNAASGWSTSPNSQSSNMSKEAGGLVSREDWRAVCAVLLENYTEEVTGNEGKRDKDSDEEDAGGEESEVDGESDEYQEGGSDVEKSSSGLDDEYIDGPSTSSKRKRQTRSRTREGKNSESSSTPSGSRIAEMIVDPSKLTKRQTQTCLETFSLFFPDLGPGDPELMKQRIMIKDLQRVANLLGEKMKAEEMVEMLELFSTSPDKSMNFSDFQRMMIIARLA